MEWFGGQQAPRDYSSTARHTHPYALMLPLVVCTSKYYLTIHPINIGCCRLDVRYIFWSKTFMLNSSTFPLNKRTHQFLHQSVGCDVACSLNLINEIHPCCVHISLETTSSLTPYPPQQRRASSPLHLPHTARPDIWVASTVQTRREIAELRPRTCQPP